MRLLTRLMREFGGDEGNHLLRLAGVAVAAESGLAHADPTAVRAVETTPAPASAQATSDSCNAAGDGTAHPARRTLV